MGGTHVGLSPKRMQVVPGWRIRFGVFKLWWHMWASCTCVRVFFFFSSWLFSFEQYGQQQQHVRYTRELDTGCAGISGCIKRFEKTLSNADVELATHLARQGVRSEFYAFRWLVTLNSREFELPEVRIYSPPSFWSDNNNTKLRYWDFGMQSFPIGDTFVRTDLYTIFVQPC